MKIIKRKAAYMRILPIVSYNSTNILKTKAQNQKYNNGMDTVSFSAKIPQEVASELKYKALMDKSGKKYSEDDVLTLFRQLRYDNNVSNDFKTEVLLLDNNYRLTNEILLSAKEENCDNKHYEIAKAMIEASPDKETTKSQLLTSSSLGIPLLRAGSKEAKMLLEASPDKDTFMNQLLYKIESRRFDNPFLSANHEKKQAMLDVCDYDTKKELLLNPFVIFDEDIEEHLSLAPDEETKKDMLQVTTKGQDNLFHKFQKENDIKLLLGYFEEYPDILKKLLLQPEICGYIPITQSSEEKAELLLAASPDEETLAKQLTAKDRNGDIAITRFSRGHDGYINFLELSPDDDTLMTQLFSKKSLPGYEGPVIGLLPSPEDSLHYLDKLENISSKKQLLMSSWEELRPKDMYSDHWVKNEGNLSSNYKIYGNEKSEEHLFNILYEVIQDDTTSNEEALKLTGTYKYCLTGKKYEYLKQIEKYLMQQPE